MHIRINIPSAKLLVAPAWARLSVTCRSEESHNNSGISAKEQEEPPVCLLRYPPFLLFVEEWSHVPAARKPVISAPEQANNAVSKRGDGQTRPHTSC